MADITLRSAKGMPLTNAEVDANFSNLNTDVASRALATHNHNSTYLGITAKAADSELLDGFNSTAFLRSVNGVTPDGNGNVAVDLTSRVAKAGDTMTGPLTLSGNPTNNLHAAPKQYVDSAVAAVDLSTRVAKSGDTMTGNLVMQGGRLQVKADSGGSSSWIDMFDDESPNGKKYIHANSNYIGFVGGDGNWKAYVREDGHFWTSAYGWLNDYFFRSVSNCQGQTGGVNENCYGGGNIFNGARSELIDEGGNLRIRYIGTYSNCNCK